MTGTVAYILAKKIALGAVSGIKNIVLGPTGQLIFYFNNGSSATWQIPLPSDGADGVSVSNIQIDANNHLICTMSDGSTIDAGQLPDNGGGGLIQVNKFSDLTYPGKEDTLYLVLQDETLYYWNKNKYNPLSSGGGANSIDFVTDSIEFDDVSTIFDMPVDNKSVSIYVNGIYLTENEDYTIDRSVIPNTIEFVETWETTDLCTIVWVKGKVDESSTPETSKVSIPSLEDDITSILDARAYILDTEITNDPWPTSISINGSKLKDHSSKALTANQKELVKTPYIIDKDNKIIGVGYVTGYNSTSNTFDIVLNKYGQGTAIDLDLATKEDIDKLFQDSSSGTPITITLATKSDIDNLFDNSVQPGIPNDLYATKEDIDNIFK